MWAAAANANMPPDTTESRRSSLTFVQGPRGHLAGSGAMVPTVRGREVRTVAAAPRG